MKTEIIPICGANGCFSEAEECAIERAGQILKNGGLVAFPTETVYGLGGDALNPDSSRKIYAAKGRPGDNPLIVHISEFDDIYRIAAKVPESAVRLAEAFWPGPLTMILKKSDLVPKETTGGLDTVAVRMPSDPIARELIRRGGGYVAAPSANRSGRPSPTIAKYVIEDLDGRIDAVIDGGRGAIGLESTIVDLTIDPPQILRPGYITDKMLADVLGRIETDAAIIDAGSSAAPRAPGMKYRHYAPKGTLVIVEGTSEAVIRYINEESAQAAARGEKTGVIATEQTRNLYRADSVKSAGSRDLEESIARNLYTILREFDDEDVTCIYSECFDTEGFGQAIMNRLLKAAGHRIVHL